MPRPEPIIMARDLPLVNEIIEAALAEQEATMGHQDITPEGFSHWLSARRWRDALLAEWKQRRAGQQPVHIERDVEGLVQALDRMADPALFLYAHHPKEGNACRCHNCSRKRADQILKKFKGAETK